MYRRRPLFLTTSWFAALLLVLNALWPLVTHARPADSSSLSELCMPLDAAVRGGHQPVAPAEQGSLGLTTHCPWCLSASDNDVVLPPAPVASLPAAIGADAAGFTPVPAEPRIGRVLPALPRAPPVLI